MFSRFISRGLPLSGSRFLSTVIKTQFKIQPYPIAPIMQGFPARSSILSNLPLNHRIEDISSKFIQPSLPVNNAVIEEEDVVDNTIYTDSVLRKRRLKMKKHKLRKRRKAQRSLMKRLGKI